MNSILRRRRAMMAQTGGEDMVPGKTITITSAIVNGGNVKTVLAEALSTAGITGNGAAFTTKPRTTWDTNECACFIVISGQAGSVYRGRGESIQALGGYAANYDITASSGQTFYVVEETP